MGRGVRTIVKQQDLGVVIAVMDVCTKNEPRLHICTINKMCTCHCEMLLKLDMKQGDMLDTYGNERGLNEGQE